MGGVILVFGSNDVGRHGKGAALMAKNDYGAVYGVGVGRTGMAYAIPTKEQEPGSRKLRTLPLARIKQHVDTFLQYAKDRPDDEFLVTALGTGLAGYHHRQIAPMFRGHPSNCAMPPEWREWLL
jgi:hypothetical protein